MVYKFFSFVIISEVLDIIIYILLIIWGIYMIKTGSTRLRRMWYLFFSFFPLASQLFLRLQIATRILIGIEKLDQMNLAVIFQGGGSLKNLTVFLSFLFTVSMLTNYIILVKKSRLSTFKEVTTG